MANQHQFWRVLILQILPFSNSVGQRSVRLSTENKCRHNLLLHQWDIGQSGQHWLFQAWVASRYRLKIWGSLKKIPATARGISATSSSCRVERIQYVLWPSSSTILASFANMYKLIMQTCITWSCNLWSVEPGPAPVELGTTPTRREHSIEHSRFWSPDGIPGINPVSTLKGFYLSTLDSIQRSLRDQSKNMLEHTHVPWMCLTLFSSLTLSSAMFSRIHSVWAET